VESLFTNGRPSVIEEIGGNVLADANPQRASAPRAGETFGRRAEQLSRPIRSAVSALCESIRANSSLQETFLHAFGPRFAAPQQAPCVKNALVERSAWALVNICLAYRSAANVHHVDLAEAENWFFGSYANKYGLAKFLPRETVANAIGLVELVRVDEEFHELLPYLLEPFGAGSRFSVMRDPSTKIARQSKREQGVYFTPRDLATYMVRAVADQYGSTFRDRKCFDPASGTAIFLLAFKDEALQGVRPPSLINWMADHLYGADINPLTIESGTFVLLINAFRGNEEFLSPFAAWHLLRANFLAIDAIHLRCGRNAKESSSRLALSGLRDQLRTGLVPAMEISNNNAESGRLVWLHDVLPDIGSGADVLVGNPPYGDIGTRIHELISTDDFQTFRGRPPKPGDDIHLFFIEMMWSLVCEQRFASALVVPLSVSFNRGKSFCASRAAMMNAGCEWRFAFFDREPHALFGEDVKTRNAVLIASRGDASQNGRFGTTHLLRWTSRNRRDLFSRIRFTVLKDIDITMGVPKLEGAQQAAMYWTLRSAPRRFEQDLRRIDSVKLSTLVTSEPSRTDVFVGTTAYNFINAFFAHAVHFDEGALLSENALHRLSFQSTQAALAGYAVLASRLAHWLWTVEGDGFHVPRWFLEELPIQLSSFYSSDIEHLAALGAELWSQAQGDVVRSVNKAKHSIAYRTTYLGKIRDNVDAVLCDRLGLPETAFGCLKQFEENHVLVDAADPRRRHRLAMTKNLQRST